MHRKIVRLIILSVAVVANLGVARVAAADLKEAVCEDPETGQPEPCCDWCWIFCGCDFQP